MESSALAILIQRYIHDELSEAEVAQLWETLRNDADREQWESAMEALMQDNAAQGLSNPESMERVWQALKPAPAATNKQPVYIKWRWMAAASLLAALAVAGTYLLFSRRPQPAVVALHIVSSQIPVKPGTNKAVLTLADGTQLPLDSSGNGALAVQGNSRIVQQSNGQLTYASNGNAPGKIEYNNLHIPRGGQFRLTLSDGTKVWLNAASDLRYPASFDGGERRVELTGEAYFEVAQMPAHPFKVIVNNTEVQVLGTSFNVSAYGDEAITKTTLLEGAVNVKTGNNEARLHPGQQAQILRGGQVMVKDDVDVEEVIAWKNGYFQFNHENITGVMNQLSRWYDLDVSYQGDIPGREFGGRIARSSSIEQIVTILELSKIHVKIDNKKIIVMP